MNKLGYLLIGFLFLSCGGSEGIKITTEEIDQYVETKLDASQEFEVSQSLRFSRENETYEVVRYMQNDSVVLYLEIEATADEHLTRQTFFKSGVPVFVDEYTASNLTETPFTQRKIYLDGANVIEAQMRSAESETDLEFMEYGEGTATMDEFNFTRPDSAMNQLGNYEMKFEEFIIIDPQTYLILENEKSKYDVALFVTEATPLLDQLFAEPSAHEGRTIFVTHQFVLMNNIERMLFVDGYFKDEVETEEAAISE